MRKSQIYKEHLKEQGIAVKWFPLTDPLVHWPEGAHPILGEAATGHSANKGEMHLLALSVVYTGSVGSSEAEQTSACYMKRPCQRNATKGVRSTPNPCLLWHCHTQNLERLKVRGRASSGWELVTKNCSRLRASTCIRDHRTGRAPCRRTAA